MKDEAKTKEQLISELAGLRQRVAELEISETERKKAEETLRLQAAIMCNVAEGVVITRTKDAVIVYTNPKLEEMVGYGSGELIGKNISLVNAPTDKRPEEIAKDIQRDLEETGVWQGEVYNTKKDGTPFWCHANVSTFNHHEYGDVWVATHTNITERKRATEQLEKLVQEKELLIREVHHRVKNNLQVISSLLDMSSLRTRDQYANYLITNARSKIYSMSIIHSQLYTSDSFDKIDIGSHIREMVTYLFEIYTEAKNITSIVEVGAIHLEIAQAIPYAIVLNELVSNALQYAFREKEKGVIRVCVERLADGTIHTRVKDDGIGIPPEFDIAKADTLGLKLVRNVVQQQLKGKVWIKRERGAEFIIEFKP